jgi:hypothetical protein
VTPTEAEAANFLITSSADADVGNRAESVILTTSQPIYLHKALKNMHTEEEGGSSVHELAVVHGRHVSVTIQRSGWIHVGDVDRPLVRGRIDKHVKVEGQIQSQVLQEETGLVNELGIVLSRKQSHNVGFESIPEKVILNIACCSADEWLLQIAVA